MKLEERRLIWRGLVCTDIEKQARREQVRNWAVSFLAIIMMFAGIFLGLKPGLKGNETLFLSICGLVVLAANTIKFEIKMSMLSILKELRKGE